MNTSIPSTSTCSCKCCCCTYMVKWGDLLVIAPLSTLISLPDVRGNDNDINKTTTTTTSLSILVAKSYCCFICLCRGGKRRRKIDKKLVARIRLFGSKACLTQSAEYSYIVISIFFHRLMNNSTLFSGCETFSLLLKNR